MGIRCLIILHPEVLDQGIGWQGHVPSEGSGEALSLLLPAPGLRVLLGVDSQHIIIPASILTRPPSHEDPSCWIKGPLESIVTSS